MMKLEPINSLALTLHHSPGVQALLLGSGVSRAAGIPTGWDITLDLIRRLAHVQGETSAPDWLFWYRERFGKEPNYSEILDAIATTPTERRSIIHQYIEAQDGEDIRQPTKAHRAIAKLVSYGSIKVILTTNFDRLLENALRDTGIEPTVIASDDALLGSTPLVHARCTVIKLHGDYMDARIKNTTDELEQYSPGMEALLDRILNEYGLIVTGWSGDWDIALRNAILRSSSRRYPFYWAFRGSLTELAHDLVRHREGINIEISDADRFFSDLLSKVENLKALNSPHPESTALTIAAGKRFCRSNIFSIEWLDLNAHEIKKFSEFLDSGNFSNAIPDHHLLNEIITHLINKSETLRRLVMIGVRWGTDEAFNITLRTISALTFPEKNKSEYVIFSSLRLLAASMCFHWAVCAAITMNNYNRVAQIMNLLLRSLHEHRIAAVTLLPLGALQDIEWKALKGYERIHFPYSFFFLRIFVDEACDIVVDADDAQRAWDDSDFLIAAEFGYHRLKNRNNPGFWFFTPLGRFIQSSKYASIEDRIAQLRDLSDNSPQIKSGLFGGNHNNINEIANFIMDYIQRKRNFII